MADVILEPDQDSGLDSFYKNLVDHVSNGVYFVDRRRKILFWNKGAEKITGFTKEQAEGSFCYNNLLMHIDHKGTSLCKGKCPLSKSISTGEPVEKMVYLHHADGHRVPITVKVNPIYGPDGKIIGAVETFEENKSFSSNLKWLSELEKGLSQDMLTGVFNRQYGETAIKSYLQNLTPLNPALGCLFVDIDLFKTINDTYGHDIGDKVLKMVAGTLRDNLRVNDIIIRWGGEEFIVLLVNVDKAEMKSISNTLRRLVEKSCFLLDGESISVTVSIGATLSEKGDTIETLVKRADELMYVSKNSGRNRVAVSRRKPLSSEGK